jgi:hypothetical protein
MRDENKADEEEEKGKTNTRNCRLMKRKAFESEITRKLPQTFAVVCV